MLKKLFKKEDNFFFRKDKEGRDVFYPWGYPGESFYLEKNQKKYITLVLYFLGGVFLIDFYAAGIKYNSDNYISAVWMWITPVTILASLYFVYVFFLFKKSKLQPNISLPNQGVSAAFRFLLAMLLAHSGILGMAIYIDPNYIPFKLALVFILFFYAIVCVLAFQRKGYFLQNPSKHH